MKHSSTSPPARLSDRRKGIAMILAIIVLILTSSISLSMIRTTSLRQQRFENRQWKLQTDLIADSAIERVYEKLLTDDQYTGDVWKGVIDEQEFATTIKVNAISTARYAVECTAIYPVDSPQRTQSTINVLIDLNRDQN